MSDEAARDEAWARQSERLGNKTAHQEIILQAAFNSGWKAKAAHDQPPIAAATVSNAQPVNLLAGVSELGWSDRVNLNFDRLNSAPETAWMDDNELRGIAKSQATASMMNEIHLMLRMLTSRHLAS